ncbi:MAG: AmmeMemoRadiSam system protein B [Caldisphaera sp.]|uniref:AmmeMemoRadiSam system protein B n=1 Tax=Caldisphaera sp. TaxID=2060322 RepID=UPI00397CCFE3
MVLKRQASHAGSFYPLNKDDLIKSIENSYLHKLGPGNLPKINERKKESIGYIVPHAGYMYSGPIAAHSYFNIANEGKPKVFVIVGPNHTGLGENASVWKEGIWQTPLGDVEIDNEVSRLIVSYSKYFTFDEEAHLYEHSVEVQIPFLQQLFNDIKIVPIVIKLQNEEVSLDLANALYKLIVDNGVDLVNIASSDMNHYEPYDITYKKDEMALKKIEELDVNGLFKVLDENNITMCGPGPVGALLYLGKKMNSRVQILKHATSGDITGEKDWVVGYAAARVVKA